MRLMSRKIPNNNNHERAARIGIFRRHKEGT
jgi:hypothetical protein